MTLVAHVTTVPMSLRFLRGQADFMRGRGYELMAVSSPGPALEEFGRSEGVPVEAVEMPRRVSPLADAKALLELSRVLARARPEIVHAHTPKGGLLGVLAARVTAAPSSIYHMRGLPLMGLDGWQRALLTLTETVSCRAADRVLCVSQSLREEALSRLWVDRAHIEVLANGSGQGVDLQRFDPSRRAANRRDVRRELGIEEDCVVFGFVGRLVGDKGIRELAEAWPGLEGGSSRVLLIIGGYEDRDPVPAATRAALRTDGSIRMLGFREDTERLYAAMDAVVLPTYREGFPNVPLEAAAAGLPVVATRVAGCVDAVQDEVTGLLVPPRDAVSLARAMSRYASNPQLRRLHGAAGRSRVERLFAREVLWSALADTYDRLRADRDAHRGR